MNGVINDADTESEDGRTSPAAEPGIMFDEDGVLLGSRAGRGPAVGANLGEPASPADKPTGEVMWVAR